MRPASDAEARALARNRNVLVSSSGLGFLGFTLSMAFLPLYIAELGVKETRAIAVWTGLCFGITPLMAAIVSNFWARLAVRFGKKIMVERALFSFIVIMALMGRTDDVRVLFFLRFLQGVFGGYAGMILSMVASSSPKSEMGRHIGTLQSVQTFSTAIGPMIGGLISSVIGLRSTFYVTSAMFLVSLVYVHFGYREEADTEGGPGGPEEEAKSFDILRLPGMLSVFIVVFLIQYIDRSFGPVIPMHVARLHGFGKSAAIISGFILTSGSVAVAFASIWWGRRAGGARARSLILITAVCGTIASLGMALAVNSTFLIALLRVVQGLTAGGSITLAFSWGGMIIPSRIRTSAFTLLTSASLYAISVSPLLSGLLMSVSTRLVFLLNTLLYASVLAFLLLLGRLASTAGAGATGDRAAAD